MWRVLLLSLGLLRADDNTVDTTLGKGVFIEYFESKRFMLEHNLAAKFLVKILSLRMDSKE